MCLGMRPGEGYFARGSREGGSFEECKAVAMKMLPDVKVGGNGVDGCAVAKQCLLMGGSWALPRLSSMPVYAFSHLHYRPEQALAHKVWHHKFGWGPREVRFTLKKLAASAEKICSTSFERLNAQFPAIDKTVDSGDPAYLCTDASYLFVMLFHGLGIPIDESVRLIGNAPPNPYGVKSSWMIGDALLSLHNHSNTNNVSQVPLSKVEKRKQRLEISQIPNGRGKKKYSKGRQ